MVWALRKAGVEEWLVRIVMAMYKAPRTCVRSGVEYSEEFEVKVGVHQGSVLSPLVFVIVMDAIAKELGGELPWELLYADDMTLMEESEGGIKDKLMKWKSGLETRGMKVNMSKTKVMKSMGNKVCTQKEGKWPCRVCNKGVGSSSILCSKCGQWVHKKCSGVKRKLTDNQDFECKSCMESVSVTKDVEELGVLDLGNGMSVEKVSGFCYLGDMLGADGSADMAVEARIRSG